jgi:hypothetical protein
MHKGHAFLPRACEMVIELHSVYPRRRLMIRGKRIEFLKVQTGLEVYLCSPFG